MHKSLAISTSGQVLERCCNDFHKIQGRSSSGDHLSMGGGGGKPPSLGSSQKVRLESEEETGKVCVLCTQSLVVSMRYDVVTYKCPTSLEPIGR